MIPGTNSHSRKYPPPPTPQRRAPLTVTTGTGLRIHAVQTGSVAVKSTHRTLRVPTWLRTAAIVADPIWTEWLPIYAWVVEHPEGLLIIDTGETSRVAASGYFACDPATAWVYRHLLRFAVAEEAEIGPQLRALGLAPDDVRWVVLTHLHSDHAGGLAHFPRATILLSRAEHAGARHAPLGALPCRWPTWFDPTLVDYRPERIGPFAESFPVTRAGDIQLVPTPGHSAGHQSVIVHDGPQALMFAGDASFSDDQIRRDIVAGICADVRAARQTVSRIRHFLRVTPTIYLPTHDPKAGERLAAREVASGHHGIGSD